MNAILTWLSEAGMGAGPNTAAAASCKHPVVQGMAQMISVFPNTLVICSPSAMILLLSGVDEPVFRAADIGLTGTDCWK